VTRFRAWRFQHPDFDGAEHAGGLQLSERRRIDMVEDSASVRQSILLLLTTRPGERVMRPGYGCDLHKIVFSPNDDTTAGLAIHYVRQAITTWEPRVELVDTDATRDDATPGTMHLTVIYRVKSTQRQESVSVSVDIAGGRS
jgi:uncharacterized protein